MISAVDLELDRNAEVELFRTLRKRADRAALARLVDPANYLGVAEAKVLGFSAAQLQALLNEALDAYDEGEAS